jgi:hypothetical protein
MSLTDAHWTEDLSRLDRHVEDLMAASAERLSIDKATLKLAYRRPNRHDSTDALISPTGSAVLDSIKAKGEDLTGEVLEAASSMLTRDLQTMITPVDTDQETRQACKHLQTWADAVKEANQITLLRQRMFMDGASASLGALYVYGDPVTQEVKIGRWLPTQVLWNDEECPNGEEPLDLFYIDSIPTRRLCAEFPSQAREIKEAGRYDIPRIQGVDSMRVGVSDNRQVILAFSRKIGTKKGRYVMKVGKGGPVLADRKTDWEHHPVGHFIYTLDFKGWGGRSLALQVARQDLENQDLNGSFVRTARHMVPIIWKKVGTTWESTINQDEYQVQEYDGPEAPKVEVPKIDLSVIVDRMAYNRQRAYSRAGINPELAEGKRPGPSLNSEPSIEAAVDTSIIRLADIQARWGEADRELTRAIVMVGMDLYKGKPEVVVRAPGTATLKKIDWTGIANLTEKKYEIQTKLASGLSLTWAGRLRDMKHLQEAAPNAITEETVLRSLKLPDVETELSRATSYQNEAERLIEVCLNEAEGPVPTPLAYPELLKKVVTTGKQELMRALNGDTVYHPDNVEKLRKLIDKSGKMLADLEPPMPSGQPLPTPAPPGPAGAPPGQVSAPAVAGALPGGAPTGGAPGGGLPVAPAAGAGPLA